MPQKTACIGLMCFLVLVFGVHASQAGWLDKAAGAVNDATSTYDKVKDTGNALGLSDNQSSSNKTAKASSSKNLPGGVVSRIKNANKELDKADKSLVKGAGSQTDRAARAKMYLDRARTYRAEIDKRYKGKFSLDAPTIQALDDRLASVDSAINQAGSMTNQTTTKANSTSGDPAVQKLPAAVTKRLKEADRQMDKIDRVLGNTVISADSRAEQAAYNLRQAKNYIDEIDKRYGAQAPASDPQMKKVLDRYAAMEEKVRQASEQAEDLAAKASREKAASDASLDLSNQWAAKFKLYTQSGTTKTFHPYATDDQIQWEKWDTIWAELGPLWQQYQTTTFSGPKSPDLASNEQLLTRYINNYKELSAQRRQKQQEAKANLGQIVFAKSRINPASPQGLTNTFQAGDHIYALIMTKKSWSEIYNKKKDIPIRIDVMLGGKKIHAQFVTLHNPDHARRSWLDLEIAPEPSDMKAYSDADIEYGKSNANLRQGPMELSQNLAKLPAGRHKMELVVKYYGKTWASGSIDIHGSDFSEYAELSKKASQAVAQSTILPRAKQNNPGLADKMHKILLDAGWPEPYRINIIDKDWWLNRVSGGNSPISSRHMAAAVMAKDGEGYYYKACTFEQKRLVTGGWGTLELTHTGDRVPILEANKDK